MLNSGHHDCSTKAVFLCTPDKLQCWPMLARNGTYWRMLAFGFLHISFIGTIASVVLITFSLAGRRKNADVHNSCFCGKAVRSKPAKITFGENKDVNSWISLDCTTILLRQPWEEVVPGERTPWHYSKHVKFRPSWLFHKSCLSLHSWKTAMLPHVGTLNSERSAFSTFHSTFIRAIGSVVLSKSF